MQWPLWLSQMSSAQMGETLKSGQTKASPQWNKTKQNKKPKIPLYSICSEHFVCFDVFFVSSDPNPSTFWQHWQLWELCVMADMDKSGLTYWTFAIMKPKCTVAIFIMKKNRDIGRSFCQLHCLSNRERNMSDHYFTYKCLIFVFFLPNSVTLQHVCAFPLATIKKINMLKD